MVSSVSGLHSTVLGMNLQSIDIWLIARIRSLILHNTRITFAAFRPFLLTKQTRVAGRRSINLVICYTSE